MDEMHPCRCGCGLLIAPDKQFARGHWSRTSAAREMYRNRRKGRSANPDGLCLCGCGQTTPLAKHNKTARGYYAGEHIRYVPGHRAKMAKGPLASKWKGGVHINSSGYRMVLVRDHPRADKDGYVSEHRYVMEQTLGRRLESYEHVHHINGNKLDNRPENLSLLAKEEHHRLHQDSLMRWRATTSPEEQHEHASRAGKLGAAARWKR